MASYKILPWCYGLLKLLDPIIISHAMLRSCVQGKGILCILEGILSGYMARWKHLTSIYYKMSHTTVFGSDLCLGIHETRKPCSWTWFTLDCVWWCGYTQKGGLEVLCFLTACCCCCCCTCRWMNEAFQPLLRLRWLMYQTKAKTNVK